MNEKRTLRIGHEVELLKSMALQHEWVSIERGEEGGETSWIVEIRGKGIIAGGPGAGQFAIGERHRIALAFPEDFPQRPPQIEFQTPVFHPNIAATGRVALPDLGMAWQTDLSSDVLIERIWDLIRGATMDLENAIHGAAARWYSLQSAVELPIDRRGLAAARSMTNIVRYRHKRHPQTAPALPGKSEPMMIGDASRLESAGSGIHFIE
jgi:ubiquitin-protein ligase